MDSFIRKHGCVIISCMNFPLNSKASQGCFGFIRTMSPNIGIVELDISKSVGDFRRLEMYISTSNNYISKSAFY